MAAPPPKRIASPAGVRLDNLVSRSHHSPQLTNMPFTRRYHLGDPPREDAEKKPPSYTTIYGEHQASRVLSASFHKILEQSGGWRKPALISLLVLAVIIALGIGLGIGLNRKSNDNNKYGLVINATSGSLGSPVKNDPQKFPIGSFSLITFLDNVATNCTSNPATWNCYPYETYSASPKSSQAVFNWVISNSSTGSEPYVISSSDNPFSVTFSGVPLNTFDVRKDSERYTFSIPMIKQVWPTSALVSDNIRSTCFFNNTILSAMLYTKKPNTYPGGTSLANLTSSGSFALWPAAVDIVQASAGGANVPDCFETQNNQVVGSSLTHGLQAQPQAAACSCLYRNFMS